MSADIMMIIFFFHFFLADRYPPGEGDRERGLFFFYERKCPQTHCCAADFDFSFYLTDTRLAKIRHTAPMPAPQV